MPNSDPKSKVSLEELLRLKRAERPSQEFWSGFERELRQKQLTALVKKRRWWHEIPALFSRRAYVPAGAAAVVTLGFISLRVAGPAPIVGMQSSSVQVAATEPAIETLPATVVAGFQRDDTSRHEAAFAEAIVTAQADVADLAPVTVEPRNNVSPSARSIAANLARLEQSEPELVNSVMGSRLSSPGRVQAVAAVQSEEEADLSQKYRLIARYAERALSPEPVAPALVRERIARRLGDDLADDISRIGVKGSRVSLKF